MLRNCVVTLTIAFLAAVASAKSDLAEHVLQVVRSQPGADRWTFKTTRQPALEIPLEQLTGFRPELRKTNERMYLNSQRVAVLPRVFDWREKAGGLPAIKNQKSCGSCWAFGTVFVLEALLRIRDGVYKDLSEQHLVSCNQDGWSCNGGYFAHEYHNLPGAALTDDFPYVARDVKCKSSLSFPYKIESWAFVGSNNKAPTVEQLKNALYEYGPLAVTVAASRSFQAYSGGVYNANDSKSINHLVNLVGWNDDQGAWIMRNSWGESWGEQGYMRIKYGVNRIANDASFAVYKAKCNPQPVAYTGATQRIKKGGYARLGGMAVPGDSYTWSPAIGLDDASSASPYASPDVTTLYTVLVKNACGTASRSVQVIVEP